MSNQDLNIQIVISALDLATRDIEGVNKKVRELGEALTTSGYTHAAGLMDRFGEAVKGTTEPLAAATTKSLALAAALDAVITALAINVHQAATGYESVLSGLAKVSENGTEEARQYGEQLDVLAIKYGANGERLVDAMTSFKQAGFESADAIELVERATQMMISGEMDAAESSANLVSILKGFRAPASEAAHVVDLLNEVSNRYATDVRQLSDGMAGISPIAKAMGFSLSETAGLLTPIIEVYQSGAEAADALKMGLQRLTDDATPVTDALAQIGVSQTDANGALRSGREIFIDVASALGQLSDAERQQATAQLVGIEQAGRMAVVFGDLAKVMDVTSAAETSSGSAMAEVSTRMETSASKTAQADEKYRQLAVTLGNQLKDEITGVVTATGTLAAAFDAAVESGSLSPLLDAIRPQISALQSLIEAMASNLELAIEGVDWSPLVDGLTSASGELGELLSALFDGLDLRTVDGLRNAIQSVANVTGTFAHYVAGLLDGLEPLADTLSLVWEAMSRGQSTLPNIIGQIEGLGTSAHVVIPVIAQIASTVFGTVGTLADWAVKIGLAAAAWRLLVAAGVPVGPLLSTISSTLTSMLPTLLSVVGRFTGLTASIQGLAGAGALLIGYNVGGALREWAIESGQAADAGLIARTAYQLLATDVERLTHSIQQNQGKAAQHLAEISERTGVVVDSMDDLNRAEADGILVFDRATAQWVRAKTELQLLDEASQRMLADSEAMLAAHQQEADILTALTQTFARAGQAFDAATGAVGDQNTAVEHAVALSKAWTKQLEAEAQAHQRQTNLIDSATKAAVAEATSNADLMTRLGNETAARHYAADAIQAQVDGTRAKIETLQSAAELERQHAAEILDKAGAYEKLTEVEKQSRQELIDSANEKSNDAEALRHQADMQERQADETRRGAQQTRQSTEANAEHAESTDQVAAGIERAAAAAAAGGGQFDALRGIVERGRQELSQYGQAGQVALDDLIDTITIKGGGVGKWMDDFADGFRQIEARLSEAQQAQYAGASVLTQRLASLETISSRELYAIEQSARGFDMLDQQTLSGITSEVERLRRANQQLTDELDSTIAALQDELDRLTDNQDAIEQRDYEKRRRELQQTEDEARQSGNDEAAAQAAEALRLLDQVHQRKMQDLADERQERERTDREQTERENARDTSSQRPGSSGQGGGAGQIQTARQDAEALDEIDREYSQRRIQRREREARALREEAERTARHVANLGGGEQSLLQSGEFLRGLARRLEPELAAIERRKR